MMFKHKSAAGDTRTTAHKSAVGASLRVAGRFVARLLDLLVLLVLARILEPQDFGKVALAMTLVYIVEALLEIPVAQALMRAPAVKKTHIDTAFTLGLMRGLLLASAMAVLSRPYADFNRDHDLGPLVCALGVAAALRSLISPAMVHYARRFEFRPEVIVEITGKTASLISAVSVGLLTHSYWALVAGAIAGPLAMVIASYVVAPYRPRLSLEGLPIFQNLLVWQTLLQLFSALNWQMDRLALGRYASPADLGTYALARDIATLPQQSLIAPFWVPLIAGFATVVHDQPRSARAYLKALSAIMLVGLPVLVGMGLVADPGLRLLLGDKWDGAALLLSVFCFSNAIALYAVPFDPLALALNRSDYIFRQQALLFAFKLPSVIFGAVTYGVNGVLVAVALSQVVYAVTTFWLVSRVVDVSIRDQLMAPHRAIVAMIGMIAVVAPAKHLLQYISNDALLIVGLAFVIGLGALAYTTIAFALWSLAGRPAGGEAIIYDRARSALRRLARGARPQES